MRLCDRCEGELDIIGFRGKFETITIRTVRNAELCRDCAEDFQDIYQKFIRGDNEK